jgi:hypothetical protein
VLQGAAAADGELAGVSAADEGVPAEEQERRSIDRAMEAWLVSIWLEMQQQQQQQRGLQRLSKSTGSGMQARLVCSSSSAV